MRNWWPNWGWLSRFAAEPINKNTMEEAGKIVGSLAVEKDMNVIEKAVSSVKVALTPKSKFAEEHDALFKKATIRPEKVKEIDFVLAKLLPGIDKYKFVASKFSNGLPWYFILMTHAMEAGGKQNPFFYHLHCGDPLTARTKNVPKGRPKANPGGGTKPPSAANPYTWEESAIDALKGFGDDKEADWSIGGILWREEQFNGLGYRKYHKNVPTPYVYSYTNIYTKGKYVSDGKFDANAVSKQPGCAAYIIRLKEKGLI